MVKEWADVSQAFGPFGIGQLPRFAARRTARRQSRRRRWSLASDWRMGPATQPQVHSWITPRIADLWGTAAADAATPLQSWIRAGVRVACGSDSPFTEADPLVGIGDSA
ncbi:hypothetical protein Ssi02_31440 [Sinosporangium siamense]|uniref:Uncharacterized protein n=1 Tax=Sinosporangium siamense TaxID=1367973 RepID=A0A919V6X4_9ACTN|nr:hypothetical protein Ssi02_31440 [Sinosporangium siamense]